VRNIQITPRGQNGECSNIRASGEISLEPSRFKAFNNKFDGHKSVHHLTIQINQPTRCNSFTSLLLDVHMWLNMVRASPRPSSGAYNCTRSLWFYRWKEAAGALLVMVWPDHDQHHSSRFLPTVEPEAPSAVVCS